MNNQNNIPTRSVRQSGFTLFEVLISIIILSIGLTGLARLQATGLMNSHSAYQISQATVLAYDIADRMRSNTDGINNYLTSFMTLAAAESAGAVEACGTTTGCTPAQMAQTDLRAWKRAMSAALKNSTGVITVDGNTYTITVNWDNNRDGVVDSAASDTGDDGVYDLNFAMSFQP